MLHLYSNYLRIIEHNITLQLYVVEPFTQIECNFDNQ
jgi:hypothetical protein